MASSPRDAAAEARLREFLSFDPSTGALLWIKKPSKRVLVGARAGFPTATGHLRVEICKQKYWCHHVGWLLHYGAWPDGIIDHVNGAPSDNRIENLRIADASKNMQNSKIHRANSSGYKGVSFCGQTKKWRATITKDGRHYSLGRFTSIGSACDAYRRAAEKMFGEFARAA